MSWAITAVAAIAVGSAAYSADSQRKAAHTQQDAINKAQQDDATAAAEAQTQAALSANQKLAADKRSRQANLLALGGNSDSTLGQPAGGGTVLAAGATPAQRAAAGSVLGGGAPLGTSAAPGMSRLPTTPTRASAL